MKYELNNIYNANSYDAIKDVPDNSIDCVYIDIPYLYNSGAGGKSDLAKRIIKKRMELMKADEKYINNKNLHTSENLRIAKNCVMKKINIDSMEDGIDYSIFDELCRVMKKINIFIWCSKMQINDIMNYFVREKECHFEILLWLKTNPTPSTNNVWLPDTEYCLYFRESGVKLNDGYDLKHKWYITGANVDDKNNYEHPTIKPLEIVKKHILHATQENDVVLDCFMGSGTTAVACKETNRQYLGFEIDPKFCKIANDRVNGITANGQTTIFTDFDTI